MLMEELNDWLGKHNYLDVGREDTAEIALTKKILRKFHDGAIPEAFVTLCCRLEQLMDSDDDIEDFETPIFQLIGHNFLQEFKIEASASRVASLTAELAPAIAFIQEATYGDTYYLESLDDMLNAAAAANIASKALGHKLSKEVNLSVLAFDDTGLPAGYLLAYPAKSVCSYGNHVRKGMPVIYVHDIAVLPGSQGQGIAKKLIKQFMSEWMKTDLAVLADVRRDTSYPMLQHYVEKGIFDMSVLEDDDDMLKVLVRMPL